MKIKSLFAAMVVIGMCLTLFSSCSQPGTRRETSNYFGSVVINAPPEKVFAYLADPLSAKEWNSGVKEIWEVEGQGLGMTQRWKYEYGGHVNEGKSAWVEYLPNRKIVEKNSWEGGFSTETTILSPHPQGTKLILIIEFFMPVLTEPLAKMTYAEIQQAIQQGCDEDLQQIKAAVEKK